jgi:hypothetical protein
MNWGGIVRLLNSSKGLVFLGVVTAGVVLVLTGHLSGQEVYDKIINLSMVFFPAVAAEDVAKNLAARPQAPGVQQNVNLPPTVPPPPMAVSIPPLRVNVKEEEEHG